MNKTVGAAIVMALLVLSGWAGGSDIKRCQWEPRVGEYRCR